jgi:toxin FitB
VIILDTNVVSELMVPKPASTVLAWADSRRIAEFVTTSITVMELYAGLERLDPGKRKVALTRSIERVLEVLLDSRILPFDKRAARATATWFAASQRAGRPSDLRDAQIAGIAISRRIPLATRNVRHFEGLGVKVVDPWSD